MPTVLPEYGAVRLRRFELRDVDMVLNLATDPYVPLIGTLPAHADAEQAAAWITRQDDRLASDTGYPFCIALRDDDRAVGAVGLWTRGLHSGRATAGYSIAPRDRGRGFAGQALAAVTAFAWSLPDAHRVELYIEPANIASIKTAEACGYEREGLLRSHQEIGGRRVDMLLYAVVRPG